MYLHATVAFQWYLHVLFELLLNVPIPLAVGSGGVNVSTSYIIEAITTLMINTSANSTREKDHRNCGSKVDSPSIHITLGVRSHGEVSSVNLPRRDLDSTGRVLSWEVAKTGGLSVRFTPVYALRVSNDYAVFTMASYTIKIVVVAYPDCHSRLSQTREKLGYVFRILNRLRFQRPPASRS